MKLRTELFLYLASIVSLICPTRFYAQQGPAETQLKGYNGAIVLLTNTVRDEVTLVLTLRYSSDVPTNQIVFHLQSETSNLPPSWKGSARVLVGDGVLVVLPQTQSRGFLFKFDNVQTPSSLDLARLDSYPVYGIARYGEKTALAPAQIEQLVLTGKPGGAAHFNP